ncbi:DUF6685 family protein [Klebsiella pneumoniae]|nr:DUF6685 family protein [Klebsiella pneumoniae]MCJ7359596.1 hypothetical protein [Klebsiella pneumoniae]WPH85636.1 DUF6685 family protein [Klebsiella pneumoniae]
MIDNGISSSTPLWRKILQACQDELLNSLGYPATLRRRLNNGALPVKLPLIEDTIWLRSVVCWHTWLSYEQNSIRYLRPGHDGDYDYLKLHIPQLAGLVSCEITENYLCDISEIGGMSCSRNSDRQCSSLEDFALQCCRELTIPVSGDHLDNNLSHSQLGVVCGKGRNPTLRLWPAIFSGEIDVFPGDRRSRLISSMTSVAPA